MMSFPLICDNPFRLLGLFANATQREIEQNKAQLRAFARVGQKIELPLWLNGFKMLPPLPEVTGEMRDRAYSQISILEERERFSLFWFERDRKHGDDDKAISLLNSNELYKACEMWRQRDDYAAHKNLLLIAVLNDDWNQIASETVKCWGDSKSSFNLFLSEVIALSPKANGLKSYKLLDYFSDEGWREETRNLIVANHSKHLNMAINRLKSLKIANAELLRAEIERLMYERKRIESLRRLTGSESFSCSYYTSETAKQIMASLEMFVSLTNIPSDIDWAVELSKTIFNDVDINDSDYHEFVRRKFIIGEKKNPVQHIDIPSSVPSVNNTPSSSSSDTGCVVQIIVFILFFSILILSKSCIDDDNYSPYNKKYDFKMPNPSMYQIDYNIPYDSIQQLRNRLNNVYVPDFSKSNTPARQIHGGDSIIRHLNTIDSLYKAKKEQLDSMYNNIISKELESPKTKISDSSQILEPISDSQ